MPQLVSGGRAPIRCISSLRILASAAESPPPPYSFGQSGTVQPRSAITSSHCRWASDWKVHLRPPQQASASDRSGWRISVGQLASSHARVSARKASISVMGVPISNKLHKVDAMYAKGFPGDHVMRDEIALRWRVRAPRSAMRPSQARQIQIGKGPSAVSTKLQTLVNAGKGHGGEVAEVILRDMPGIAVALARQDGSGAANITRGEPEHRLAANAVGHDRRCASGAKALHVVDQPACGPRSEVAAQRP